jgi:hypothetical protein
MTDGMGEQKKAAYSTTTQCDLVNLPPHMQLHVSLFLRQVVRWFWRAVEELNTAERQRLLRFVTAVGRPPLNGFGHLQPPFTIRLVPFQGAPVCRVCNAGRAYEQVKQKTGRADFASVIMFIRLTGQPGSLIVGCVRRSLYRKQRRPCVWSVADGCHMFQYAEITPLSIV